MRDEVNLYKILGIKKTAAHGQIYDAYKRAAKKYHPDTGSGDTDKFIEVKKAYETLKDPARRKMYDELGVAPDTPEFQELQNAVLFLQSTFLELLKVVPLENLAEEDLLGQMQEKVTEQKTTIKNRLKQYSEVLPKLEEALQMLQKQMKKKPSTLPNIFQQTLENEQKNLRLAEAREAANLCIVTKGGELLKDYSFTRKRGGGPTSTGLHFGGPGAPFIYVNI